MPEGLRAEKAGAGEQFKQFVGELNAIIEHTPPEQWWRRIMLHLKRAERNIERYPEEMRSFLNDSLEQVYDILSEEVGVEMPSASTTDAFRAERAREVIHEIAQFLQEMAPDHEPELPKMYEVSLDEILRDTEHFELGNFYDASVKGETANDPGLKPGERPRVLRIRASREDPWHDFPLPPNEHIMHKGGTPRVVLKILAGAPVESIRAELPPNDFDVIAVGEPSERYAEAAHMGVDLAGVEMVESLGEHAIATTMNARDIDLNMCLLGKDGMHFSDEALQAAKTGHISLKAEDRGIYGSENFYFNGEKLAKNRGMFRLIKFVAEGKATSFDMKPLNEQVRFGIYWLVLARKFASKKNGGTLLNRMFELGKRMHQVPDDVEDIYGMLNRVHEQAAFFDFQDSALDDVGLARWLNTKLSKFAQKTFRARHGIPSSLEMERKEGDTTPYRVSLDGYVDDPVRDAHAKEQWDTFIEACRRRTAEYQKQVA
jgi:hypothetical protein